MARQSTIFFIKYLLFLFGVIPFIPSIAFSQLISTPELIKHLMADDVYQTDKFGVVGDDLIMNFNESSFTSRVMEIQRLLLKNPDQRLRIRLFMYERLGYEKMNKPDNKATSANYFKMIQWARELEDEQLLSELYSKHAGVCEPSEKLYYLLKCLEIQDRIGQKYFSNISSNYYWASDLLYKTSNYKSSATYAARGVNLWSQQDKKIFLLQYIVALNLAGASYLKISKAGTALNYYKHIGELIDERAANPDKYKSPVTTQTLQIWRGIVKGGIGKAYMLQKKHDAAYPLLLQNLISSTDFEQWDDVANLQISLAKIDELRHNTPLAMSRYSQAYRLALKNSELSVLVSSAESLSTSFAALQQFDSAYVYHNRYLQWNNTLDKNINQSRLDILKSQVVFERMQKDLQHSQNNLVNQKYIRNYILIAVILFAVIALLLYNRKRLSLSIQNERLEKERQKSEHEIIYVQQQIDVFTKNIIEKNNLIEQLQKQLTVTKNSEINTMLSNITILTEEDWQKFKINFEIINPNYINRLIQKMPQITKGEKRIILLVKLGFTTKEMGNATGVSPETIRSVISRMRKKFNLNTDIHTIAIEV